MNEWIMRVMPLPARDRFTPFTGENVDLARFRIRILAPSDRPGGRVSGARQCTYDVGSVRIIGLDSANPHGGVGGSFDTEQCAWLVRELEEANAARVATEAKIAGIEQSRSYRLLAPLRAAHGLLARRRT